MKRAVKTRKPEVFKVRQVIRLIFYIRNRKLIRDLKRQRKRLLQVA